jgi:hypothetical protein
MSPSSKSRNACTSVDILGMYSSGRSSTPPIIRFDGVCDGLLGERRQCRTSDGTHNLVSVQLAIRAVPPL